MPELVADLYNESGSKRKPGDDVGFFESALAGVATGLWNVPKKVFSFGAEIYDLIGDTNTAKEIEDWFDDVNPFDDEAEARTVGKVLQAITQSSTNGSRWCNRWCDGCRQSKKNGSNSNCI
jgi:hypothetical protein